MDCLQLCDKGTLVSLCDFLPCLPQLTGHTHSPPLLCPHSGQQHLYLLWAYPDRMDTALGEALCPPNFHVVLYEVLSKCMLTVTLVSSLRLPVSISFFCVWIHLCFYDPSLGSAGTHQSGWWQALGRNVRAQSAWPSFRCWDHIGV